MSAPLVVTDRTALAEALAPWRAAGDRVALVPTMGALHAGHATLIDHARSRVGQGSPVVVSVFVNPLQFGPEEDLDRYPRTLETDLAVCAEHGVDVVFAPAVDEVYPGGLPQVTVDPGPLARRLEGRSRPGHFAGVLTVVAKLLGLVRPDLAVFGEKDYQQLVLVRRMAADLCLGVEIVGAPTVREADGLALSSRNAFLDPEQRERAVALSRTLFAAVHAAPEGLAESRDAARAELRAVDGVDLDYLEFTAPDLGPLEETTDPAEALEARVLIAARVGGTRLIDNLPLHLGRPDQRSDQRPASDSTPTATTTTGK